MTPRLTLSIRDLRRARACGLPERIEDLRTVLPDVSDGDDVDVRVWWALPSTSTADAIWSLRAARTPERAAAVAVLVAQCAVARAEGYAAADAARADAAAAWAAAALAAAYHAARAAPDADAARAAERDAQRADLLAALEIAP